MYVVLVALLVGYFLIVVAAWLFQKQLIYFPYRAVIATPTDAGLAFEEIWLESTDGNRFLCWYIPREGARKFVVCFHGNADNISTNLDLYQTLHDLGVGVIAFEYRGYSGTPGSVSERALDLDLATLGAHLRQRFGADSVKYIGMGRSLGGAVAVRLSTHLPLSGLILESTFNSMTDIARKKFPYLPVSLILTEKFDSEVILREADIPVLVIHSPNDEVVPFELAEKLFAAARGPKKFLRIEGGHNSGVNISGEQLQAAYADFLDSLD